MKKVYVLTLIILCVLKSGAFAQQKNFIDMPYVEVSGSADSMVTPNEIYIKIILSEKDSRDKNPLQDLENKMAAVLKKNEINPEKDLTTSDMASNFKGYIFSKSILKTKEYLLKVSTADQMTRVITELEDAGISNTSIDHVNHSNIKNIRLMVKGKASEDARKNAAALLRPYDRVAGALLFVSDNEQNISGQLAGRVYGLQVRGLTGASSAIKQRIEFEKIKVASTVNAKFAIK